MDQGLPYPRHPPSTNNRDRNNNNFDTIAEDTVVNNAVIHPPLPLVGAFSITPDGRSERRPSFGSHLGYSFAEHELFNIDEQPVNDVVHVEATLLQEDTVITAIAAAVPAKKKWHLKKKVKVGGSIVVFCIIAAIVILSPVARNNGPLVPAISPSEIASMIPSIRPTRSRTPSISPSISIHPTTTTSVIPSISTIPSNPPTISDHPTINPTISDYPTSSPRPTTSVSPSLSAHHELILSISGDSLEDETSPQYKAFSWIEKYVPFSDIQPAQILVRYILMVFYHGLNGDQWRTNIGWGDEGHECEWHGVVCENGVVIHIVLGQNSLAGQLPSEIGHCESMKAIDFGENQITGQIPSSMGMLINLEHLRLSVNSLSGEVPSSFANLTSIKTIRLERNDLVGSVDFICDSRDGLEFMQMDRVEVVCKCCN